MVSQDHYWLFSAHWHSLTHLHVIVRQVSLDDDDGDSTSSLLHVSGGDET